MERISQLELLSEGFWSAFTKPAKLAAGLARGAVAGGAKALDYVLPELTRPLQGLEAGVRDIGKTAVDNFERVFKGRTDYIRDELADIGYIVKDNVKIKRSGKNFVIPAYKILQYDTNGKPNSEKSPTPFLIDKSGRILRNLRHAKMHP